jgi:hypothetical protein
MKARIPAVGRHALPAFTRHRRHPEG